MLKWAGAMGVELSDPKIEGPKIPQIFMEMVNFL